MTPPDVRSTPRLPARARPRDRCDTHRKRPHDEPVAVKLLAHGGCGALFLDAALCAAPQWWRGARGHPGARRGGVVSSKPGLGVGPVVERARATPGTAAHTHRRRTS